MYAFVLFAISIFSVFFFPFLRRHRINRFWWWRCYCCCTSHSWKFIFVKVHTVWCNRLEFASQNGPKPTHNYCHSPWNEQTNFPASPIRNFVTMFSFFLVRCREHTTYMNQTVGKRKAKQRSSWREEMWNQRWKSTEIINGHISWVILKMVNGIGLV